MRTAARLAAVFLLLGSLALAGEAKKPEPKPAAEPSPDLKQKLRARILGLLEPAPTSDAEKARIKKLIEELRSDSFQTREAATNKLVAAGQPALPALRAALKDKDPEVADRSDVIIERIKERDVELRLVEELRKTKAASLAVIDKLARERAEALKKVTAEREKIEDAGERKAADERIAKLKKVSAQLKLMRHRVEIKDYLQEASRLLHKGKYAEAEKLLNAFVRKPGSDRRKVARVSSIMGLVRMLKTQGGANKQAWISHIDRTLGIKKK